MEKNQIEVMEPGASSVTDFKTMEDINVPGLDIDSKLDQDLINEIEEKISSKKEDFTQSNDIALAFNSFMPR